MSASSPRSDTGGCLMPELSGTVTLAVKNAAAGFEIGGAHHLGTYENTRAVA